jgi:hypothetical protein
MDEIPLPLSTKVMIVMIGLIGYPVALANRWLKRLAAKILLARLSQK